MAIEKGDFMQREHITFLIKPASGNCNMKCSYCFYVDEMTSRKTENFGMMDKKTSENLIKRGLESARTSCTFAFQGGEPTVIGLDFYRDFVEMVRRQNTRGIKVNFALQTNGVLIDEEWASFFRENEFLVGVSLDGPAEIHNMNRKLQNGNGSYNKVMNCLELLKKHKVETNILTVVTSQTARFAEKVYRFMKKNGFNFQQYIACLDPLHGERGAENYSLSPESYGEFLCKLFDLWFKDLKKNEQPYIRYFENLVALAMGQPSELCSMNGRCVLQYVIEADGGAYPCDFYVTDNYLLGNINQQSLEELDKKSEEIEFIEKSLHVEESCKACRFGALCRGGCRRDRDFHDKNELQLNYFCESYKIFFEYAYERIVDIARIMMRGIR